MDKTDKYIDDLFHQKFSDAGVTIPPSGAEWLQLSRAIRKKNFLRFSPGNFNVFYLTAAAAAITTVASFVLPDLIRNNKNEINNQPSTIIVTDTLAGTDSLLERDNSAFILKEETSKSNCSAQKSENKLMKDKTKKENSFQSDGTTNMNNDFEIIKEPIDSLKKTNEKTRLENSEIINENHFHNESAQTDTIIKIDTIHIQKKGVQFKRKKDAF